MAKKKIKLKDRLKQKLFNWLCMDLKYQIEQKTHDLSVRIQRVTHDLVDLEKIVISDKTAFIDHEPIMRSGNAGWVLVCYRKRIDDSNGVILKFIDGLENDYLRNLVKALVANRVPGDNIFYDSVYSLRDYLKYIDKF